MAHISIEVVPEEVTHKAKEATATQVVPTHQTLTCQQETADILKVATGITNAVNPHCCSLKNVIVAAKQATYAKVDGFVARIV